MQTEILKWRRMLRPKYFWEVYNLAGDNIRQFEDIIRKNIENYAKRKLTDNRD